MAESTTVTSPTDNASSPLTGFSSYDGPIVPADKHFEAEDSMDQRVLSMRQPSINSFSSVNRSVHDKALEDSDPHYGYTVQAIGQSSEEVIRAENGVTANGHKPSGPNRLSKPSPSKKEKKGSFRNTLRRMFGKKPKTRISMPTPAVAPRRDPEDFITAAASAQSKPQRSVSVPTANMTRESALSSHPPYRHTTVPSVLQDFDPPPPERRAPERPPRPRRASVPSVLLNREEVQAVEAALSDPDLLEKQEQTMEARNIGFAITNGSNPKRRSRSVGACPSPDHRMSPIQWHHIRRRSDEIRYWRQSTPLPLLEQNAAPPEPEEVVDDVPESPEGPTHREVDNLHARDQSFNFGLPPDSAGLPNHERVGMEERLLTLEIKLMDLEYALSKIQAGEAWTSRGGSQVDNAKGETFVESYPVSEAPRSPLSARDPSRPLDHPAFRDTINTKPGTRPTSVATTLKASQGTAGVFTSTEKPPGGNRSNRASLNTITIEHYSTLITLLRHEQFSRQRLEEQVSHLQSQVDRLSTQQHVSHSHQGSNSHTSRSHSHSHSLSSHSRGNGILGSVDSTTRRRGTPIFRPNMSRGRSSSDATTTDEEAYHDAYVTPSMTPVEFPRERGEFERGAFERVNVEEGMAF